MRDTTETMGTVFTEWLLLTDAYTGQLDALFRREPGAAEELTRLGRLLGQCEADFREAGWDPYQH